LAKRFSLALLWDIDGTLLQTGRAGIFALEDAAKEVLGSLPNLDDLPTAGLTDVEIAMGIVSQAGRTPEPDLVNRFLRSYERHLPSALPRRTGQVLPGIQEILGSVAQRGDVLSLLLTGNTQAGARAKLTHYGLDRYFSEGAFSDGTSDRPSIARRALDLVRRRCPDIDLNHVFVIGDTPHDIHCGKAIGARTIAVATGQYGEEALKICDPWWVIPVFPSPAHFFDHVMAFR
jgi:phosphoglycolate phosphatase